MAALSIALVFLPIQFAHARTAETGSVQATVHAAASGDVLSGVKVRVVDMDTAETVAEASTSDEGLAKIPEIPFGLYQVSVEAPEGYAGTAGPLVFLNAESPATSLNFSLERLLQEDDDDDGGGLPVWAWLVLLGGAGVAAGLIINEVTKDDTP